METATSIARDLLALWGADAFRLPELFSAAVEAEVRKIDAGGEPWRAVSVRGSSGPQVGDHDYFPISCCNPVYRRGDDGEPIPVAFGEHEDDCIIAGMPLVAQAAASGGVLSFPPGR